MAFPETITWRDDRVIILDQRLLPQEEAYLHCTTVDQVAEAIRTLAVRGAPAIGIAAAMGLALGAGQIRQTEHGAFVLELDRICERLKETRPTAVNLRWALTRMKDLCRAHSHETPDALTRRLVHEALVMLQEDVECNRRIGGYGKELIDDGHTILTHCNTGALATGGHGTALGIIRSAWEEGKRIAVMATETRPLLQGSRLTAWELQREGIPVTLITDSMAGHFMKKGDVHLVMVGADRIARNGDTANKIGTYSLAVLAGEHGIPFHIAAPLSTFDREIETGDEIPIEERGDEEVCAVRGHRMAPSGVRARNPAFDVTPHRYITAFVTDGGIVRPPFGVHLGKIFGEP